MMPGYTTNSDKVALRKTALLDRELFKLDIDVAALQETRLAETGSIKESHYTFFWCGRNQDESRIHGVGFAISNKYIKDINTPVGVCERIITVRMMSTAVPLNIICVYAPTLPSTDDVKDDFYDRLSAIVRAIPSSENLVVLGDFNARVGADHDSWPVCLGRHGVGRINSNGQRVLEFCCQQGLCVTNTFFAGKERHKVSWMHPRSKHWHQLDLVLARRTDLGLIKHTRVYHSADGDTDHSLVVSRFYHYQKPQVRRKVCRKRLNISAMKVASCVDIFRSKLSSALHPNSFRSADSAAIMWTRVQDATYKSAVEAFGVQKTAEHDWLSENLVALQPLIDKKKTAHLRYKQRPTRSTFEHLRDARRELQRASRSCANKYWNDLCNDIQKASDMGNLRCMYSGLKKAFGPVTKKVCPLKSADGTLLTDTGQQLARWVEHYSELYAAPRQISSVAIASTPSFPPMLELDELPTFDELNSAIASTPAGKAPGLDGIPADLLQCDDVTSPYLYSILCKCWNEGKFPDDMRDAKITTLYKNKGDKGDCNNYRGISLLSVAGKVFARVLLGRLQLLANRIYPESQCGFRNNRSTIDMIFSLRQIQEKCREQRRPLHVAFVDLTKAFDLVSREGLYAILHKIGCPQTLLSLIRSLHDGMKANVYFEGSLSDYFELRCGVKQGCVLAPTLFSIYFSAVLHFAFENVSDGDDVYMHTRSDGKLFRLARLRAKSKTRRFLVRELLFADDAALVSHSAHGLQRLLTRFAEACDEFALVISTRKTVVMHQNGGIPVDISLSGNTITEVDSFCYLGAVAARDTSLEKEVQTRIGKAATTFSRLRSRAWANGFLTDRTKGRIYRSCVLSVLLYGSETWPSYMRQERKLNAFHMRCLRQIIGVTWRDKVRNSTVLERTGCQSLFTTLKTRRLRWLGHVRRLSDGRLPKDILYGELSSGSRTVGRPFLRFKDVVKRDMKQLRIDGTTWENASEDRPRWRNLLMNCSTNL